jgi:hypothetical protein
VLIDPETCSCLAPNPLIRRNRRSNQQLNPLFATFLHLFPLYGKVAARSRSQPDFFQSGQGLSLTLRALYKRTVAELKTLRINLLTGIAQVRREDGAGL